MSERRDSEISVPDVHDDSESNHTKKLRTQESISKPKISARRQSEMHHIKSKKKDVEVKDTEIELGFESAAKNSGRKKVVDFVSDLEFMGSNLNDLMSPRDQLQMEQAEADGMRERSFLNADIYDQDDEQLSYLKLKRHIE